MKMILPPVIYQQQLSHACVRVYELPNIQCHPPVGGDPLSCRNEIDPRLREDDTLIKILPPQERTTLSHITHPALHHQKLWSYILTRVVLGEVLGVDPKDLGFDRTGKPRLVIPAVHPRASAQRAELGPKGDCNNFWAPAQGQGCMAWCHFNISHAHNLWAIAWSFKGEVGIDIEKIDNTVNYTPIMRQFFTAQEQAQIHTPQDFFNLWTQKEALLKRHGLSIAHLGKMPSTPATLYPLSIHLGFCGHLALDAS